MASWGSARSLWLIRLPISLHGNFVEPEVEDVRWKRDTIGKPQMTSLDQSSTANTTKIRYVPNDFITPW